LNNRINGEIRIPTLRLIDQNGNQLGIVSNSYAKSLAENAGLDLVEISPTANPPVCKILDFGKYKYETEKKQKEEKSKQFIVKTKEIQFHPNVQFHDYEYRLEHAKEFLEQGHKVKACVVYRGREMNYRSKGEEILKKFVEDLSGIGLVEQSNSLEGNTLSVILRKV